MLEILYLLDLKEYVPVYPSEKGTEYSAYFERTQQIPTPPFQFQTHQLSATHVLPTFGGEKIIIGRNDLKGMIFTFRETLKI